MEWSVVWNQSKFMTVLKRREKSVKKKYTNNSNNSNQQHTYHREKHENDLGQYYN